MKGHAPVIIPVRSPTIAFPLLPFAATSLAPMRAKINITKIDHINGTVLWDWPARVARRNAETASIVMLTEGGSDSAQQLD